MSEVPEWAFSPTPEVRGEFPQSELQQPFTRAQLLEIGRRWLEGFIKEVVRALAGALIPGSPAFEQLRDWAENLPNWIVTFINTHAGIDLTSWDAFIDSLNDGKGIDLPLITKLRDALQGFDLDSPGAVMKAILENAVQLIRGVIPPWMLPPIHVGRLTEELPPLVADGDFEAPPVGDSDRWFRDADRSALAIVGNGEFDEFIARPVAVAQGQKYEVAGEFSSETATGAAGSVKLVVFEFGAGDDPINTHVIGSFTPTGTQPVTVVSGEYVVPDGVQMAAVALQVTEEFTAGTVYVDNIKGPSTGKIEMSWVRNLVQRWQQVAKLFGIVDTDLDGDVDLEDVWNTLWNVWLKPLDWIPNVVQTVIDGIHNGFANFGELLEDNLPRSAALDTIYSLLGLNLDAKTSISVLEAEVRLLKSEGNTLSESFERPDSDTLGSNWSALHTGGGGAGGLGVRDGAALWYPSGSGNRWRLYRYNPSQITTDAFELSFVLANDPPLTFPDDAYGYACFRCSDSEISYGRLRIGQSSVVLQAVVSGTTYTLASASVGLRAGDVVTIRGGKAGGTDLHTYSVLRKGQPIIDEFTDPNARVKTGAGFRGMGCGGETSFRLPIFPPIPTQWVPAGFAAMTMAETL